MGFTDLVILDFYSVADMLQKSQVAIAAYPAEKICRVLDKDFGMTNFQFDITILHNLLRAGLLLYAGKQGVNLDIDRYCWSGVTVELQETDPFEDIIELLRYGNKIVKIKEEVWLESAAERHLRNPICMKDFKRLLEERRIILEKTLRYVKNAYTHEVYKLRLE